MTYLLKPYGKSIFDVNHNIDIELKRKYKHIYWIEKNRILLLLTIIIFWIVIGYFIADKTFRFNTILIILSSYGLICFISTYFFNRFLKEIGREISAYKYYLRHKSKREWEKKSRIQPVN